MLSLAKETLTPRLARNTIFIFRSVLAAMWIFEGIWRGFLSRSAPSEKVTMLAENFGMAPDLVQMIIGGIAILAGLWLLGGWTYRLCVLFQVILILLILWLNFQDTLSWFAQFFQKFPTITLMVMVWLYGPGTHVLSRRRRRRSRSTWKRG
jgi:uncharacterized membrane protein YphA (DoxX/SURF4 family)